MPQMGYPVDSEVHSGRNTILGNHAAKAGQSNDNGSGSPQAGDRIILARRSVSDNVTNTACITPVTTSETEEVDCTTIERGTSSRLHVGASRCSSRPDISSSATQPGLSRSDSGKSSHVAGTAGTSNCHLSV